MGKHWRPGLFTRGWDRKARSELPVLEVHAICPYGLRDRIWVITSITKKACIELPEQAVMAWVLNSLNEESGTSVRTLLSRCARLQPDPFEALFARLIDKARGKEVDRSI